MGIIIWGMMGNLWVIENNNKKKRKHTRNSKHGKLQKQEHVIFPTKHTGHGKRGGKALKDGVVNYAITAMRLVWRPVCHQRRSTRLVSMSMQAGNTEKEGKT